MSGLAGHRIDRIESVELPYRYPRTVGRNARLGSHGSGGSLQAYVIRTDTGATGWGAAAGELDADDRAGLVGRPVEDLIDPDSGVLDNTAAALDFALHDLAGRLLDVPVHAMLSGSTAGSLTAGDSTAGGYTTGDSAVTCYSGAIYFDDLDPSDSPRGLDAVLANCADDHAAGFRAFKLKIGRGHRWMERAAGLHRDIEVTRAVRSAYPRARILVDANDGYSCDDLLAYLDAVADCDLFWIEEPFPESVPDLRRLRDRLDGIGASTVIADGESDPDVPFLLELAEQKLVDVLLMDVIGFGLTAWRRLIPTLRELDVQASPHAWGQPLKTLYAGQLAIGLGQVLTVEGVPGRTLGVDTTGYRLEDGLLHIPSTPGFGIALSARD